MNNKIAGLALLAVSSVVLVSGCATIVSGQDQTITFNSEPDGAIITVAGNTVGKTPASIQVDRGSNKPITFKKEGYKTYTTQLTAYVNPWFFGNIIIGGLLGSTTDGASGAINEYAQDQYFVTLTPETTDFGVSASKTQQVKELVLAFSDEIRSELTSGGGESVDALIELLDSKSTNKERTMKALNKLSLQHSNDLELANSIIKVYGVDVDTWQPLEDKKAILQH